MSSLRERNLLYARLEEVLGAEPAGILMNHIPTETDLATKADIDALSNSVDGRFDRMDEPFDRMDERFDRMDERFDRMDERFDRIDERIDRTDTRLDRLEASMVRFDTKLDGFHAALRDQTRTYMLTMTGVMASFAAVVVATGILT